MGRSVAPCVHEGRRPHSIRQKNAGFTITTLKATFSKKSPSPLSPMSDSHFFNAQHSPIGAFASFTLGFPGQKGGLGLEIGGPADENVYIGMETRDGNHFEALPFFAGGDDESRRYDVSAAKGGGEPELRGFAKKSITREFAASTDTWKSGDLSFSIYSPVKAVPDPKKTTRAAMMEAIVPAVFAEITADNTQGKISRKVFFGYQGSDRRSAMRRMDDLSRGAYAGVGQGLLTAIVSDSPGVYSGLGFTAEKCLRPDHPANLVFGLGGVGMLMADVPAGKKKTFRFAICFHRAGIVTSGMPASYFHNRFFPDLESVAAYALKNWAPQKQLAKDFDRHIAKSRLSADRHFQLCHAIRSYYGSTQFLEQQGKPFWVVNEGEYRMMNTFDLTVDHLFFEMAQNPWAVRNQLDWFVDRFSYQDKVRLPGDSKEYPGGISFTHDMGIANQVSRPHFSTYELFALDGCFSHMTHEQLVNWVLCGVTYARATKDSKWLKARFPIFKACLRSLIARDHPDPKQRDGVMSADSSRCLGGAEITTYDSLDISLGQARNNLYLAVKTWAAYVGLSALFAENQDAKAEKSAHQQAKLCACAIASNLREDGFIPAVMGEGNTSRIIPAIEGLVFPKVWGMEAPLSPTGEYADLILALTKHLKTVLTPGVCLFEDGSWKLSSTNDNSWLSKIYLCQFVAEQVLGVASTAKADAGHRRWLLDPENAYFAWSDQMVNGIAKGSKYYPRGVTAWLWLR